MNKKVLGITIAFLIAAILTTPVYAGPEKGQKVPIAIHWTSLGTMSPEGPRFTGLVMHNHVHVNWSVVIDVDDELGAWTGFANFTQRDVTNAPQPDGLRNLIFREDYDLKITGHDGGFKGSSLIIIGGYNASVPIYEKGKAHGLLQGYGDFEGQTINAGHSWVPAGPPVWYGWLLQK